MSLYRFHMTTMTFRVRKHRRLLRKTSSTPGFVNESHIPILNIPNAYAGQQSKATVGKKLPDQTKHGRMFVDKTRTPPWDEHPGLHHRGVNSSVWWHTPGSRTVRTGAWGITHEIRTIRHWSKCMRWETYRTPLRNPKFTWQQSRTLLFCIFLDFSPFGWCAIVCFPITFAAKQALFIERYIEMFMSRFLDFCVF